MDFWSLVRRGHAAECWPWQGTQTDKAGYGLFRVPGKKHQTTAHRVAWMLIFGQVPTKGEVIMHLCDSPPCCNPAHLRKGTHTDNARDREAKGRGNPPRGEANLGAKLTAAQVAEVRATLPRWRRGMGKTFAHRFGVSDTVISDIKHGHIWLERGQPPCPRRKANK